MLKHYGWTDMKRRYDASLIPGRLRAVRERHGWSQAKLGRMMNLDSTRISTYESGRVTPSVQVLCRLADALCCPIESLVRVGKC